VSIPRERQRPSADKAAIGIDVGGTKIALAVVSEEGILSARRRITNRDLPDARALLAAVAMQARDLAEALDGAIELVGVGVGICELVDLDGEIRSSTSVPWKRAELTQAFASVAPVTLEPDVRVAALAEARLGAGRSYPSFVYLTVGTGISHCLVHGGAPYRGSHGIAQLIGSSRITLPCPDGRSPTAVALEDVAAGPPLVRRYNERAHATVVAAEEVLERAHAGDDVAAAVAAEGATVLGSFVALLVNVLDPAGVVVGGGLGAAPGPYWDTMVASARSAVWSDLARGVPIVQAELGADAGVVGAGLAALQRSQRVPA
jgi:glucokinase